MAVGIRPDLAPPEAARAFFRSFPGWFRFLFEVRETMAGWIGLKTDAAGFGDREALLRDFRGDLGESLGLFRVCERTESELIFGAEDRHLDFRFSFLIDRKAQPPTLTLTTLVKLNGWLGRAYFLPVGAVHRVAPPAVMERMRHALGNP